MATTAVAKRDQREQMRQTLAKFQDSFARVLPKHLTPERVTTLALVAATKTPDLLNCSPESIALAVMQVSQWGLEIGRTAHLVPFRGQCVAIADWKGLVELILRSGHIRDVKARCVYSKEHFRVREGSEQSLEHQPIWDEKQRGELIAAYAIAFTRHGQGTFEVLGKDEIDRIRAGAVSKDSPAWKNHYAEMAKKTAIRRLAKRLPQSPDLQAAIAVDEGGAGDAFARFAAVTGELAAGEPREFAERRLPLGAAHAYQQSDGHYDLDAPPLEDEQESAAPTQPAAVSGTVSELVAACPVCAGPMHDQRTTKTNVKAPDYRCRNGNCEGVYWPGQWPPKPAATDDQLLAIAEAAKAEGVSAKARAKVESILADHVAGRAVLTEPKAQQLLAQLEKRAAPAAPSDAAQEVHVAVERA